MDAVSSRLAGLTLVFATGAALLGAAAPGSLDPNRQTKTAATAAAGNWPQWRGPMRDGVSTETGLLATWPQGGPPKLWSASGLGAGFSSVAVAGGRIYTMGDRRDGQYVIALSEDAGKELWATRVGVRHDDEYGGPRSTPTVDGDALYVVTTSGDVVCLEAATGRERWRRSMPRDFGGQMMSSWMFAESPLVDGDRVVVTPGASKAVIITLEKRTGKDIWRAAAPRLGSNGSDGAGYSSVVISNGAGVKQYIQLTGRGVISIRAADGWFMWGNNSVANNVANIATPIVKDDLVFASTGYQTGAVLLQMSADASGRVSARERYFLEAGTLQNHHGGFVLINGVVYGGNGHNNGFPFALDLASGKMLWDRVRGAGTGSAAVTAADGHLYFRYQDGTMALIAANPGQYQLKSSFAIPNVRNPSWSHPVVTGGRMYLREQDALHVYSIRR
jgi:outer membrane protein assembly factor BamB